MEQHDPNDQPRGKRGPTNGTWAATALIAGGIIIALVARRYREFSPPDTTQPATDVSVR